MGGMIKVGAVAMLCAALAGCGRSGSSHQPPHSSDPSVTSDFSSICRYFVATDALKRADELASDGSKASSGELNRVRAQLQKVLDVAPDVMQTALHNILDQLGTDATPQVVPDSRLLAGECRSRDLPIPDTA